MSGEDFDDDPVAGLGWMFTTSLAEADLVKFYQETADRDAGKPVAPTHQSSKSTCWSWQGSGHWSSLALVRGAEHRWVVFNAATTTPDTNLGGRDRCELARDYIIDFDDWLA